MHNIVGITDFPLLHSLYLEIPCMVLIFLSFKASPFTLSDKNSAKLYILLLFKSYTLTVFFNKLTTQQQMLFLAFINLFVVQWI